MTGPGLGAYSVSVRLAIGSAAAVVWLALSCACDDEVQIPPMRDPPPSASPIPAARSQVVARDAGPPYLTACVPEGTVPAGLAATPPFESCFRLLRPGSGVHPRGMPPSATARLDVPETVARRRSGEVIACCYSWPVRPPGSPVYQRPSPTSAPPAGLGTAQATQVRAPPPRPRVQPRALPPGMHDRPLVPSILRAKQAPGVGARPAELR